MAVAVAQRRIMWLGMRRRYLLLALPLVLAACTGARTFDQHLQQLRGKPVNDADLLLGHHATGQYQQGDATVYIWQDRKAVSLFGPSVTGRHGYELGRSGALNSALVWGGIELHTCVIRAVTLDGIIKRVSFESDPGGCETIYGYRQDKLGYDPADGRLH